MRKITRAILAFSALAALVSPAQAKAYPYEMMYSYIYYSDATYSTVVGYGSDTCYEFEGQVTLITPLWPTPYVVATPMYECRPGGPL